jgi:hypothetical protein
VTTASVAGVAIPVTASATATAAPPQLANMLASIPIDNNNFSFFIFFFLQSECIDQYINCLFTVNRRKDFSM